MSNQHNCLSCGMPIESGPYCQYCADSDGKLHGFDESFQRMVQFMIRQRPGLSQAAAEKETLAYMASMPAWKDHPQVKKART
jgi:hypothetical protein